MKARGVAVVGSGHAVAPVRHMFRSACRPALASRLEDDRIPHPCTCGRSRDVGHQALVARSSAGAAEDLLISASYTAWSLKMRRSIAGGRVDDGVLLAWHPTAIPFASQRGGQSNVGRDYRAVNRLVQPEAVSACGPVI